MITEGKWDRVDDKKLGCWLIVSRNKSGFTQKQVATAMSDEHATSTSLFPSDDEGLANAALIAAAPETKKQRDMLLEALMKLLESSVYADAEGPLSIEEGGCDDDEHREIVAECKQAIAKATP